MSFRTFMFAADALRLEEGISFHVETPAGQRPAPSPPDVRQRNAEAMQRLMGGMAGVQMKKGAKR
jgi:hypothetical protein